MRQPDNQSAFLLKVCLMGLLLFALGYALNLEILVLGTQIAWADNEAVFFSNVTTLAGVSQTVSQWGAAWADYDSDGDQDLYVGNHFSSPNLYRNNGNGTFSDQLVPAGLNPGPYDWHGAAWGDYNNDGRPDLYVVAGQAVDGSDFYANNGNGTFTERTSELGIKNNPGRGRQPAWIDYDHDGDLDLFVANSNKVDAPSILFRNNSSGSFTDVALQAGVALTTGIESMAWADYNNDGYTDFVMTQLGSAGPLGYRLYRNQGNGTFINATASAGLTLNHYPNSAVWGDYDNDGDLDLFFSRGYDSIQDKLIWNSNTITAVISPPSTGQEGLVFTTTSSVGTFDLWKTDRRQYLPEIALGPANQPAASNPFTLDNSATVHLGGSPASNLGDTTLIWRDDAAAPWNVRWQRPVQAGYELLTVITTPGQFVEVSGIGLDIPPSLTNQYFNALYRNNGGVFQRLSNSGLEDPTANSQHAQWIDVDNDADLDLYVVNMGNTYSGDEANRLYRNNGNGTFTDIALASGLAGPSTGYDTCSAWADYNSDGFLDLYLANSEWVGPLAGPHQLFLNGGNTNHWLEIKLSGVTSNRLGIGAKIQISAGGITQFREVGVGASGACQNSLVAHFGLDDTTQVNIVTVTWPSGYVQTLQNVAVDQILTVQESQATQMADLALSKARLGTGQVNAGEIITYTLNLTNTGPTSPVTATVIDTFNHSAALAAVNVPAGCTWMSGSAVVTCTVSGLTKGVPAQLQLIVTTSASYSGILTNNATIALSSL
ncbi:MAG: DUF11 domain-containing protein [Anaerolineales bacterium]|nr:DUF11 domain-containing protein [Anaerolineales bacterium]